MAGIAGRVGASVRGRVGRGVTGDGRRRLRPGPKAVELSAMVPVCGSCPGGCTCAVGETVPGGARLSTAEGLGDVLGFAVEGAGDGDTGSERRRGIMMYSRRGNEHI